MRTCAAVHAKTENITLNIRHRALSIVLTHFQCFTFALQFHFFQMVDSYTSWCMAFLTWRCVLTFRNSERRCDGDFAVSSAVSGAVVCRLSGLYSDCAFFSSVILLTASVMKLAARSCLLLLKAFKS